MFMNCSLKYIVLSFCCLIRNIARMVRLAFHDAVGMNGADGCVDLNNPDNAGIKIL